MNTENNGQSTVTDTTNAITQTIAQQITDTRAQIVRSRDMAKYYRKETKRLTVTLRTLRGKAKDAKVTTRAAKQTAKDAKRIERLKELDARIAVMLAKAAKLKEAASAKSVKASTVKALNRAAKKASKVTVLVKDGVAV
jgi:hypothetical protein